MTAPPFAEFDTDMGTACGPQQKPEIRKFRQQVRGFLGEFSNPDTRDAYRRVLQNFCAWVLRCGVQPLALARGDVALFLEYLQQEDGLKQTSRKQTVSILRSFYRHLQKAGVLDANLWDALDSPEDPNVRHANPVPPRKIAEVYQAAAARSSRDLLLVRLLYEAMLRRKDIVSLRIDDLMQIRRGWGLRLKRSGCFCRWVEITEDLAKAIQSEGARNGSRWVFPGYKGGPITPRTVNTILEAIVPGLTPLQLRVTRMHDLQHDGLRVQDIAHDSLSTVQTVIRHEGIPRAQRHPIAENQALPMLIA